MSPFEWAVLDEDLSLLLTPLTVVARATTVVAAVSLVRKKSALLALYLRVAMLLQNFLGVLKFGELDVREVEVLENWPLDLDLDLIDTYTFEEIG